MPIQFKYNNLFKKSDIYPNSKVLAFKNLGGNLIFIFKRLIGKFIIFILTAGVR